MADATTAHLAEFIVHTKTEDLPPEVAANGVRAFLNWVGCTLGGATHPAARTAFDAAVEFAGAPTATLVGRGKHLDAINTAYINCIASAAHAYDDTHLSTVIHPTGPVASAAFALAERKGALSGNDLLGAIVIGIETSCQLGHALLIPPAKGQLGWYMTGVAGAIGAAAASARILDLDEQQTRWALGIAGNQASGYRQTHGSMCTSFVPGHAARSGMHAAFLAHQGFTASDDALEGNNGFADVFAFDANLGSISERLGNIWEIHSNAFKPYPCGIVIHPVIDACLELSAHADINRESIAHVDLEVNPLCLTLCDRPTPVSDQDGQVSVQHWAAASLLRGQAGLSEGTRESVNDAAISAVRSRVRAQPSADIGRDGATVTVTTRDGATYRATVVHATGSLHQPMSDHALSDKFLDQATRVLAPERAQRLLNACQNLHDLDDVVALAASVIPA